MAVEPDPRHEALVMAALLRQGRLVHGLGLVGLGAILALLIGLGLTGQLEGVAAWLLAIALLAGLGEGWFAFRVGLDEALFRGLAEGRLGLAQLDAALGSLGLMPQGKAGRPLGPRLAGARRLLVQQAGLAGIQLLLLIGALLAVAFRFA